MFPKISPLVLGLICILSSLFLTTSVDGKRFGLKNKAFRDNKSPFVLLYEHESFRGKEHVQFFGRECVTLPPEYSNWASSIDSHRSCVSVCQDTMCEGPCRKVFSNQGLPRLSLTGFNDNIKSLKSCYQF